MTARRPPICVFCIFYKNDGTGPSCTAYPERIPEVILQNEVDHRKPHEGDHDVQFIPDSPEGQQYANYIFGEESTESG